MTYAALRAALAAAGVENSAGEARILLTSLCGINAADLPFCDFADTSGRLADAVARRTRHEPLQYILGKWPFYKEEYFVSPDCLIPRADTELLVETLVSTLPRSARLLDLCTGSGCIAISTAKNARTSRRLPPTCRTARCGWRRGTRRRTASRRWTLQSWM